jgi:hypothetical protein
VEKQLNVTLCGCLCFDDERYEWHKTQRVVDRHYRDHAECRAKARQHPVWQQRESTLGKDILGEEHDPEYDDE